MFFNIFFLLNRATLSCVPRNTQVNFGLFWIYKKKELHFDQTKPYEKEMKIHFKPHFWNSLWAARGHWKVKKKKSRAIDVVHCNFNCNWKVETCRVKIHVFCFIWTREHCCSSRRKKNTGNWPCIRHLNTLIERGFVC